jgi:hypothetical protein
MHRLNEQAFYLAYTEGWSHEPIVTCVPVAQSADNPRVVICALQPEIADKRLVVLYDRFSDGSWLPVRKEAQVGVLLGDFEPEKEPNLSELQGAFWATVFADLDAAHRARSHGFDPPRPHQAFEQHR